MSASSDRPVTVCGHRLHSPRHICCFFDSRDQQYSALMPYFTEGIANREQILTVLDGNLIDDHHQRLNQAGVAVAPMVASGQLRTLSAESTYLAGGRFDKNRMYAALESALEKIADGPFTSMRTCGEMSWALRNMPGTEDLMEYENDVNDLLARYDATFICAYDANRLTGRAMLDLLSTHSHIVMGTVVRENEYYMPPDEFRHTLLARRTAMGSLDSSFAAE